MTKLDKKLKTADSEKRVEAIYHQELERALKVVGVEVLDIKTSVKTDGIIDTNFQFKGKTIAMKIIVEVKQDETFSVATVRSKVLAQVILYLKRLEDNGKEIPHIVFVGDKDECFTVHTNYLVDYLKNDYDWSKAPSQAHISNPELVLALTKDEKLQEQCYVYSVVEGFKLEEVVEKMKGLTVNTPVKVRVTEKNIAKIFEYFTMNVLSRKSNGQARHTPREQVELFMTIVNEKNECYIHPNKPGKAVFNGKEVDVKRDSFNQFKNHYDFNYTVEEKKEFTAIADRLIEDSERRMRGDFYTPQIWVDESHKMLAENLGDNWKEEYMVWDCASGTMNLTRDYTFKELYSSTLHEHDLAISEKYNPWSVKFQYDFLNDDVEIMDELLRKVEEGYKLTIKDFYGTKLWQKAPDLITGLLMGKKLLFYINPPYGTANNLKTINNTDIKMKNKVAKTKINEIMLRYNIGACSQQLYAQFIYRIVKMKELFKNEMQIGMFSPPLYLSGSSFKGLRGYIGNHLKYINGFTFQASEFADVADNWGISFTLLQSINESEVFNNFIMKIKKMSGNGVEEVGEKTVYHLDGQVTGSDWVKEDIKRLQSEDAPQMKSALNWNTEPNRGKLVKEALGYYFNISNIVEKNNQQVYLLSSTASAGNGISILPINFEKVVSNFTARRLITGQYSDWKNWQDEYMVPNVEHELYKQWENDSIVYSIFNGKANQSSLRGIDYNGKKWNIYNHFFFMSRQEILDLAQGRTSRDSINNKIEEDIIEHGKEERFVYTKLQEITLSPYAQAVLDKARELVKSSFKYREIFNMEKPEYNINTWDAGWYQIKGLLKEYDSKGLKEFTEMYKEFEDRMRPLVYELGFLYK